MVKVGILNAETPLAGEIVRILINHPEVELQTLYSSGNLGRSISSIHHGFIGEEPLYFTDKLNLEELDFIIIPQESEIGDIVLNKTSNFQDLKVVALNSSKVNLPQEFEFGLSEINRKALVRGAKNAIVPSPIAVASLIALIPLANFLLLNSDIEIEITLPTDILKLSNPEKDAEIIKQQIKGRQNSFNGVINIKISENDHSHREARARISFKSSFPIEEVEKIYDQIYDDHNFTFITHSPVKSREVVGTQKAIVGISKPDPEILNLETVIDARMRGGAGDAVHVMNLLFGLHEKTGLNLKVARYN